MKIFRRKHRFITWTAGTCIVAALLWANGIHNVGTLNARTHGECVDLPAAQTPQPPKLPTIRAVDRKDPREAYGPTTAYTQASAIRPIIDFASKQQHLPVTVMSNDGVKQTITDTSRILAVNQNGGIAAAVVGLGLGCNLIGRDVSTQISQLMPGRKELPLVTQNGHELNAEAILNLAPTVVLTDSSIGPFDVQMQLRDAGIPVVFIANSTEKGTAGIGPQISAVGKALGLNDASAALAHRVASEVSETVAAIDGIAPKSPADRPRTVFLYLRGTIYYWFGEGSGADSLIRAIGGRDVAAEVGFKGMAPTNSEALIKAAPDVIIVMSGGLESVGGVNGALKLPGIKHTPAGKAKRIVDMSDYEVLSFGPRTAEVIAALGLAVQAPHFAYPRPQNSAEGQPQ